MTALPSWFRQTLAKAPTGLSFEQFMNEALFHPEHGYYTTQVRAVGESGDFSTSATLSPTLGTAIAAWASEWHQKNGGSFHLIEVGAGSGQLARAILAKIPLMQRWKCRYHIVEASPKLQAQQEDLLGNKVTWHAHLREALQATRGRALIFSNELVDAFPVRVFQKNEEGFEELHLRLNDHHQLEEFWKSPPHLPSSGLFEESFPLRHRFEVHESYYHWLQEWNEEWSEGELLTIDYGGDAHENYHRRPTGSLRAYLLHQLLDGPQIYENIGRQDLTADVFFPDLINWGKQLGWEVSSYQTQTEFLTPHLRQTLADTYLSSPEGPGQAFKILLQKR